MYKFKLIINIVVISVIFILSQSVCLADPYEKACQLRDEHLTKIQQIKDEITAVEKEIILKEKEIADAEKAIETNNQEIQDIKKSRTVYVYQEWNSDKMIEFKEKDIPIPPPTYISPYVDLLTNKLKVMTIKDVKEDYKAYHKFVGEKEDYSSFLGKAARRKITQLENANKELKKNIEALKEQIAGLKSKIEDLKMSLQFEYERLKVAQDRCCNLADKKVSYVPPTTNNDQLNTNITLPQTNFNLLYEYLYQDQQNNVANQAYNDCDTTIKSIQETRVIYDNLRKSYNNNAYLPQQVFTTQANPLSGSNVVPTLYMMSVLNKPCQQNNQVQQATPSTPIVPNTSNTVVSPCHLNN